MSSEEKLTIHDMKRNGVSVKEIAKRFKRSSRLISRALKEMAAANEVTPVVVVAAPSDATRTLVHAGQPEQPVPMNQHVPPLQVPQPLRVEPSVQLLPPLPQESNLPPVQMNAKLLPPPPKQRKTAQRKPSALPPPPQQSSHEPLPVYLQNGPYDGRYGSLIDDLPTDSRTMSALPASLPAPTTKASKRAARTDRQVANPQPVQQSSSPQFPPQPLQESSSLPSAVRQGQAEKSASSSELHQPKQLQAVPSPPCKQVHQQTLPQKPASASSESSEFKCAAPIAGCQSASVTPAATTATAEVVPGIADAKSGGILAMRRSITRPPRVFPFTRPTPTSSAGSVCKDSTSGSVIAGQSTVESKAASSQRVDRRTETMVPPESDLMALLMGFAPDEDTSPQTSQEEVPASSQVESLSQANGASNKTQQWKATPAASIPETSQPKRFGATPATEQKQSETSRQVKLNQLQATSKVQLVVDPRGASACHSQIPLPKQSDRGNTVPSGRHAVGGPPKNHSHDNRSLLSSIQDQVDNLQQDHIGDERSNEHQHLSAFQGALGFSSTDTTAQHSERKRKRDEDADNMILGRLLHEKMAAEVALINLQVQREKAQLHRERMKTEVEAVLSRKKLEDANISKLTIDSIFAQMMAE